MQEIGFNKSKSMEDQANKLNHGIFESLNSINQ